MEFRSLAEDAARLGGKVLQEWATKFTAREKSPANLVTEADIASQSAIHAFIVEHCPGHRFLGEEGLSHEDSKSPYRWVIDPLDGTSNYVHRFPYYAVSIGLERDTELIAGAVFDPNRDEMFSAERASGTTLNGQPVQVSEIGNIAEAMCMASLPVKTDRSDPAVRRFLDVIEIAQTVQRSGSAALNLCAVACGRIDAFWSTSLHPWDMAAGVLLVQEAGGRITTIAGDDFSCYRPDLLATNGTGIHEILCRSLTQTNPSN